MQNPHKPAHRVVFALFMWQQEHWELQNNVPKDREKRTMTDSCQRAASASSSAEKPVRGHKPKPWALARSSLAPVCLCEEHPFCSPGRILQKGEKWARGPSCICFSLSLLIQVSDMSSEEQSSPLSSPISSELTWLWKEEEVYLQKCMNNPWSFQLHFG